jgi:hypothetical protein
MRAAVPFAFCLLLAAVLAPGATPSAASPGEPGVARSLCPTVTVECPETVARPGTPITFKVKVSGNAFSNLKFRWTTSAGTITPDTEEVINAAEAVRTAVVDTTGMSGNSTATATFEVFGLDRSCANIGSCTTAVLAPFEPHPIDYYGNIRFEDEKARLDNFAIELQTSPSINGYIDCYGGRVGRRGEARTRCERAKRYLTRHRGIAPERLVLVDGGFREQLDVGLWLLPPGTNFTPSPTVDPAAVRFTNEPIKRKGQATPRRVKQGRHIQ